MQRLPGRIVALSLAVIALVGAGTAVAISRSPDQPLPRATPAGYFIRLFAAPYRPAGERGHYFVDLQTNLPDGTRLSEETEHANGGGGTCCPVVRSGAVHLTLVNNACTIEGGTVVGSRFTLVVTAGPDVTYMPHSCPIGGDCDYKQPKHVRALLGDHFERLTGDQVVEYGRNRKLVYTQPIEFPSDTCLENPPGSGHF
jgi:hypothetical protein